MSDFTHEPLTRSAEVRAQEYIKFVVLHEMEDVTSDELRRLLRDADLLRQIAEIGVCVSRSQVKTKIEAVLAMRALRDDAPVD